jgi:hypothetical protein
MNFYGGIWTQEKLERQLQRNEILKMKFKIHSPEKRKRKENRFKINLKNKLLTFSEYKTIVLNFNQTKISLQIPI